MVYESKLNIVVNDELEKTYDQTSFNIDDITWTLNETLPEGFELVIKESNIENFINVGTHDFKVLFDVINEKDEIITDQFVFENISEDNYYHSSLKINAKEVTISLNDITKTYDGNEVLYSDITFDQEGLLENNEFVITSFVDEDANYLYANTYKYNVNYNIIFNNEDVKDNYKVTIEDANITINKKELVIDLLDISKTYDTKEFVKENVNYNIASSLLDNHIVEIENIIIEENTNYPNVGTYTYDATFNVLSNDVDVTDNFEIVVNKANATITHFDLTISLLLLEKTYDEKQYEITDLASVISYNAILPINVKLEMLTNTIENNETINVGEYNFDATFDLTLNDNSVYDNFNVTVLSNKLYIYQRETTITSSSETYTYDGYDHFNRNIEATNLVDGHYIKINEEQENITICNVGSVINEYQFKIYNENDEDVTDNYDTSNYIRGELIVNPLAITIAPVEMEEITYDGQYHSYDSTKYEIVTDLSHINPEIKDSIDINVSIMFDVNDDYSSLQDSVINAATYRMRLVSYTFNYDSNFEVTLLDEGFYFTIKKYKYTLTNPLADYELIYGETPVINEYSLINEDKVVPVVTYVTTSDYEQNGLNATSYNEVYDANTYYVNYLDYIIYGNYDNYEITIEDQPYTITLTISPREIYVNLYEIENKVYDGQYISYLNNYQSGNFVYALDSAIEENYQNRLLEGEEIAFNVLFKNTDSDSNEESASVKDVGTYRYSYAIIMVSGRGLQNYVIHVLNSSADFEISKRDVTITPLNLDGNEKTYDSYYTSYGYSGFDNFAYDGESIDDVNKQFVAGETVEIEVTFNDGRYDYSHVINVGTYNILIKNYITNETLDLNNYNITVNDGKTYTINKKDIEVTFVSDEKEYDGEYLINKNYIVNGLAFNDYIDLKGDDVKVKDVDEGDITNVYSVSIMSSNTNILYGDYGASIDVEYDVTTINYNLTITPGVIRILPRTVYVKPIVLEDKIYDGKPYDYPSKHTNFDYSIGSENVLHQMVNGELLTIYIYYTDSLFNRLDYTPYNVGEYHIYIDTDSNNVVSKADYDITNGKKSNYKIIFNGDETSFNINKRPVIIHALDYQDRLYDGTTTTYNDNYGNYRIHEDSLYDVVSGQKLTVEGYFKDVNEDIANPKNVGTYYIHITEDLYTLVDENGNDVLFNYQISVRFDENINKFDITPRQLEVTLNEISDKTYDGIDVTYETYLSNYASIGLDGLVEGEYLQVDVEFDTDISGDNTVASVKNANTYYMFIVNYSISGANNVAANYDVFTLENKQSFTINKREVEITLNEISDKTYDGLLVTYKQEESNYKHAGKQGVVEGEILTLYVELYNTSTKEQKSTVVNAATYEARIVTHYVTGTNNVAENYTVTQIAETETFTIRKRTLKIAPIEFEDTYDGYDQELTNNFVYISKSLEEGHIDDIYLPVITVDIKTKEESKDVVHDAKEYVTIIASYTCSDEINFTIDITTEGKAVVKPYDFTHISLNDQYEKIYGNQLEEQKVNGLGDDVIIIKVAQYDTDKTQTYLAENVGTYNVIGTNYEFEKTLSTNYTLPNVDTLQSILEIKPLEIKVELLLPENNNREYDGLETKYKTGTSNHGLIYDKEGKVLDKLPYKDKIEIFANLTNETYNQAINAADYKVSYQDYQVKEGNLVYGNYIISQYNPDLTYTIKPRAIYINPIHIEDKTYDGKEVSYISEYGNFVYSSDTEKDTLHHMVNDQQLMINVYFVDLNNNESTPKDAKTYYIIIKSDDFDVKNGLTSNYKLIQASKGDNSKNNSFKINKREVEITLNEISDKTYDGLLVTYKQEESNYKHAGKQGVVEGEILTLYVELYNTSTKEQKSTVVNAATYEARIVTHYVTGTNNVAENYTVTQIAETETFTIRKRTLKIAPIEFEDTYDGYDQELTNNFVYISKSLEEGHIDDIYLPVITVDIKTKEESKDVVHDAKEYVTIIASYTCSDEINFTIDITTEGKAVVKPYDFTHISLNDQYEKIYGNQLEEQKVNGLGDDVIIIKVAQYDTDKTQTYLAENVGTYNVIGTNYEFEKTLSTNYTLPNVDTLQSILEIKPLEIKVELLLPENNNREYDGLETKYKTGTSNHGLIYDKEGKVLDKLPYKDKIEIFANLTNETYNQAINAADYKVSYQDYQVKEGNLVYGNYIVSQYNPDLTYTIKPRKVYVDLWKITDSGREYDGNSTSYYTGTNNFDYANNTKATNGESIELLVGFESEKVLKEAEVVNADTYQLVINSWIVTNGNARKENYDVILNNKEDSKYVINKRTLKVNAFNSISTLTYGDEITYSNEFNNYNLVEGSLVPGEELKINIAIKDSSGKLYNKKAIDETKYFNIGTYTVHVDVDNFEIKNGVSDNYTIVDNLVNGYSFTIYSMVIELEYLSQEKITYDGKKHTYPNKIEDFKLLRGHEVGNEKVTLSINLTDSNNVSAPTAKEVGVYTANFLNDWSVSGGNANKDNYIVKVTGTDNELEITKRTLHVRPLAEDMTYNGIEQQIPDSYEYINDCIDGLIDIPDLTVDVKANLQYDKVLDADTYELNFVGEVSGYDSNNFIVETYNNSLTLKPYDNYKPSLTKLPVNSEYTYGDISLGETSLIFDVKPFDNGTDDIIRLTVELTQNDVYTARPNAGKAIYKIISYQIINSKETNYTNIDISGTLEITIERRNVTVKLNDIYGRYENYVGQYIKHGQYDYRFSGSFAYNETLIILDSIEGLHVTSLDVSYKVVHIGNNFAIVGGNGLASNYNLNFKSGVIVIY